MKPRQRFGLYPFEQVVLVMLLVALVALELGGYKPSLRAFAYIAEIVGRRLPALLLMGFVCQLGAAALRGEMGSFLKIAFSRPGLLLMARAWLALVVVTYAYSFLKVSAPVMNARIWDVELEWLDRVLHFGISPTVFAVELVRGTPVANFLDVFYLLWLTSITTFQSATFWSAHLGRRRNFLLACGLLWFVGGWLYVAMPAVGPCYATPEVYAPIRDEIPRATMLQARLWHNYEVVVRSRESGSPTGIQPLLAVAAMPSFHVGGYWMLALWTRRHARRLFMPCVVATGLIFFGSLVTGWHYAVDGYVGMLLAWGAVVLADKIDPVEDESPEPAAPPAEPPAASPAPPADPVESPGG